MLKKSLSSLILEEENLKIDTKNFSSKISEATQAVKSLKIKSDEADKKLSSITSEIYTINSDKSDLERRIINLNEKIENTQNQISKFNLKNYSKTFEANEKKILEIQKLV